MAVGYMSLSGATSDYITTSDKTQLDITGDIDLIICMAPDDYSPVGDSVLISKWAASNRSYLVQMKPNGTYQFGHASDGSTAEYDQSNGTILDASGGIDGDDIWLRICHDIDDGGGNHITHYLYSNDPVGTAVGSVSWSTVSTNDTNVPNASLFSGGAGLWIGANNAGANFFSGKVYGVWVYSGIPATVTNPPSGSLVADPDFRSGSWSSGGNDNVGNTWALQGSATYVPASSPPTGRDITLNFATNTATIDAAI